MHMGRGRFQADYVWGIGMCINGECCVQEA